MNRISTLIRPTAASSQQLSLLRRGRGFTWLQLLLALACLALLLQLFPSLPKVFGRALDVRNWSRGVWLALNAIVVLTLTGVRLSLSQYGTWYERRRLTLSGIERHQTIADAADANDDEYEARVRRDADWRERAKKRLPWH